VLVWDGKTLAEFLPALRSVPVTALTGSEANLWIGALTSGAWHLHAGELDHVMADSPDPHVLGIVVSGASAYVGTPVGVVEFRDGKKSRTLAEGILRAHLTPMTNLWHGRRRHSQHSHARYDAARRSAGAV
jgi:hypothetical protein